MMSDRYQISGTQIDLEAKETPQDSYDCHFRHRDIIWLDFIQ
jgi:hypothetical protein